MYVNIIRKGSVGLFQKNFASISETQIKKQKNKHELKNQKTEMKLKEKEGVVLIFLFEPF